MPGLFLVPPSAVMARILSKRTIDGTKVLVLHRLRVISFGVGKFWLRAACCVHECNG
jgi:hypothetical protein